MDLAHFESLFAEKITRGSGPVDPAHDLAHVRRVVATAKRLAGESGARPEIVVPAAWLHDLVNVRKDDARRTQASALSAAAARALLAEVGYPEEFVDQIAHAIQAHSFSARVATQTLEAEVVQDADRLDGLGAIGVARCFATSGLLSRPFYSDDDPFCTQRAPEDLRFTVDHFYAKLFEVARTLKTAAGRAEGVRRAEVMRRFLADLSREIGDATTDAITGATVE